MKQDAVTAFIRGHRRFLVTVHANLDGDALGAELAFARLLKKLGKSAVCVNDDKTPPYGYEFLPGLRSIRYYRQGQKLPACDCLVVLDCSDLKRTGQAAAFAAESVPILNIDHHVSNSGFGAVNWVEPGASCTCELVYALYKRLGVQIDRQSALLLYTGILTDTGSFRFSTTQPLTHRIAAELLESGISASDVYKKIYSSVPYEDMQLLGRILPTMQREAGGKIIWFQLPKTLFEGRGALSFDLSESILNFARSVKGVEVVVLFKENQAAGREVRVNFRSQGKIDVNKFAALFGGGGHRAAAGATIKGKSLDLARGMVVARLKKAVNGR